MHHLRKGYYITFENEDIYNKIKHFGKSVFSGVCVNVYTQKRSEKWAIICSSELSSEGKFSAHSYYFMFVFISLEFSNDVYFFSCTSQTTIIKMDSRLSAWALESWLMEVKLLNGRSFSARAPLGESLPPRKLYP